jgi:oxalate decarboxylase/phosphoglucose isomerase-like protein (cupin superfamily)
MDLVNGEPAPRSGKLDHLVYTFPQEYHNWGETFANPRGKFRGVTQMPGATFYGGFSVALKANVMEVPHIHHANDEYLWFTGSDLANFFDFDAEIELYLGSDPDHMKKFVITEPTVVRVPPNTWHCPINFKRIGKPVAFLPVYPDGDWSKVVRQKDENGNDEYIYEAASLRRCVYEPEKICCYCGKCFSDKALKAGTAQTGRKKATKV